MKITHDKDGRPVVDGFDATLELQERALVRLPIFYSSSLQFPRQADVVVGAEGYVDLHAQNGTARYIVKGFDTAKQALILKWERGDGVGAKPVRRRGVASVENNRTWASAVEAAAREERLG